MADQNNHLSQQPTPIIQSNSHKQSLNRRKRVCTLMMVCCGSIDKIKMQLTWHATGVSENLHFIWDILTIICWKVNIMYNWIQCKQHDEQHFLSVYIALQLSRSLSTTFFIFCTLLKGKIVCVYTALWNG